MRLESCLYRLTHLTVVLSGPCVWSSGRISANSVLSSKVEGLWRTYELKHEPFVAGEGLNGSEEALLHKGGRHGNGAHENYLAAVSLDAGVAER